MGQLRLKSPFLRIQIALSYCCHPDSDIFNITCLGSNSQNPNKLVEFANTYSTPNSHERSIHPKRVRSYLRGRDPVEGRLKMWPNEFGAISCAVHAHAFAFSCVNQYSCCSFPVVWPSQRAHGQKICFQNTAEAMERKGGFNNTAQRVWQVLWLLSIGGDFFLIVLRVHYSSN